MYQISATPLPVLIEPQAPPPGTRFRTVELEICTVCDLACFGCDRLSDVASKGVPSMTVEQVALFVRESIELGWQWDRIRLLGGEPTLHPQFWEMVELLMSYRVKVPGAFLQVLSNGQGRYKKFREQCERNGVSLHAEAKSREVNPPWFTNTRIVPADRWPGIGAVPPCGIFGINGCGIGLTRHGYFLDGAGASAARVAGLDVGVMRLADVTWEAMIEQSKVLCRICGHWNVDERGQFARGKLVTETGKVTGSFWTEALERWKTRPPELRVYGRDA